ncbi:LOW QUALITY PROTEIN: cysteine-rich secretory protein 2 [Athene cunicularia]|uniref:LOW QUALITY PROTEIN: cysteine-rich secretory protein 2 n=1 Tax=Athene cunicularia TaxID=194338 RepID=UPI000EF68C3B|nr:LOW QUALITY PROTEIN: cysteine-rich secretory protein 2 [Athene cunicularia]
MQQRLMDFWFVFVLFFFSVEMDLLTAVIFLAALLHQTNGQGFQYKQVDISSPQYKLQNQKQILDLHNEIRRSVVPTASNMLKMVWSEKAAKNAEKWAKNCGMKISPRDQRVINGVTCGENVLLSSNPKTWAEAIQVWRSQSSNFKYGFGATAKNVNIENYTQLIWYNSYQIGCAVAYCPKKQFKYFYVCQYCPSGNRASQIATPYKSGPKCADCPGHCDKGLCTNPCKYQDLAENCGNLKSLFGCGHPQMKKNCPATCTCTTQIM